MDRDEISGEEASGQEDPDSPDEHTEDDAESRSAPSEAEGAGVTQVDSETAARSDGAEEGDAAERDTAMSESSRAVETGAFVLDEIHEARGLGDDVEDEYVTFRNTGDEALTLSGWIVENEDGQRFVFPEGFTLDSGANVTVHSGRGSGTETDVYWSATSGVWDDDGDTITVKTADGREVLREPYLK